MSIPGPAAGTRRTTSPWMTLCPLGTVEIDARSIDAGTAEQLNPHLPVVLIDQRPFSRRRLRRLARALSIEVEREFIVLPTLRRPLMLIDDTEAAVRHFWSAIATLPPGLAFTAGPVTALLALARILPWSWTGGVAPGRALVGRRS